ncbi:aminotransferase class I/II-fold pyridoxal phosphate-dependent enzyme [Kineococcus sp. R8]|uniref:aminotransferase-like domain-containing protein n=1 Tax=Kineococcus siccus TaxID=2696567 RepID=UPI001412DC6E|nr:PLP-dependent aminotransferase family protein [Kineococcus siccus]NAZ82732.1 aminotransferase class I/II-fold pyridoxal phosphate-dependent enzyme [Kineococcus siccus]
MDNGSSVARVVATLRDRASSLAPGAKLPSSRALVTELGVGPVTVQRALDQLVADGTVSTRPGAGTFVARPAATAAADTDWQRVALGASPVQAAGIVAALAEPPEDVHDMARGYLDAALQPTSRLAAATARAARRPQAWSVPPHQGLGELRSWFARQLGADREDVLVTPGGQGALSTVLRALVPAGSPVLVAVPGYPGVISLLRSAGLVPVPVPTDADGVRPELLERAFATTGARVLYLQPTYANPDGHVLAADRRRPVLDLAAAAGAFVVEDDFARWLGHGPTPPPSLLRDDADGRVITVNSLTKSAAPSLRIGCVVARGPVMQRIAALRIVDDLFVSRPLQEAAVELVTGAGWGPHLRTLSATLADRVDTLTAALARELPECSFRRPRGGFSLWLRLPRGTDDADLARRALAEGVAVGPGRHYVVAEEDAAHLRLCVAGLDAAHVPDAVHRLARALHAA